LPEDRRDLLPSLSSSRNLHRSISREIAKEIEKVSAEAEVNLETLKKKAERFIGTNVPAQATIQKHRESGENQAPTELLYLKLSSIELPIGQKPSGNAGLRSMAPVEGSFRIRFQKVF